MTLLELIAGTPAWVWALLGYLSITGILALKPRTVSFSRLLILPGILIAWSLISLASKHPVAWVVWLFAVAAGTYIWHFFLHYRSLSVDKQTMRVHLPGSAIPLTVMLTFFLTKYVLGVIYAVHPQLIHNLLIMCIDACVSGLAVGIFMGQVTQIGRYVKR